jgi:hypothetical protein
VTVAVAGRISPDVDDPLRALADRLPLRTTVGAALFFGTGRFTLARLIVPSPELLALQRTVHGICLAHMAPGPPPHSTPDHWTPHTTLCRRLTAAQAGQALAEVRELGADLEGQFVALRRWDGDQRVEHRLIG